MGRTQILRLSCGLLLAGFIAAPPSGSVALAQDRLESGGGSTTVSQAAHRGILDDYAVLRERVKQCEGTHRALREARQAANIDYRPNYTSDEGCIIPPPNFTYEYMKGSAAGVSLLLSPAGTAAVAAAIFALDRWSANSNCVSPESRAKAQWNEMTGEAEKAISTLEDMLRRIKDDWPGVESEFARLETLPSGSNPQQVERRAAERLAREHYPYCKINVIDR